MKTRCCLILIFIIFCIRDRSEAQNSNELEAEDEDLRRPVIYGCDDKILSDLIPKLELVKVTNENLNLKMDKMENKLEKLEKTDHAQLIKNIEDNLKVIFERTLETRLQILSSDFLNSLTKTEEKINSRLKSLEENLNKTSSDHFSKFHSKLNSRTDDIMKSLKDEIEIAFKEQHDKYLQPLNMEVDDLKEFENETKHVPLEKKVLPENPAAIILTNSSTNSINFTETDVNGVYENCAELMKNTQRGNGIYLLHVPGFTSFKAYCMADEIEKKSPAWTVIQRRRNGDVDFFRGWNVYKKGFGDLENDFWLGLDNIHALTSDHTCELLINMEDWEGKKRYAKYDHFSIGNENSKYILKSVGENTGTVSESFQTVNMKFTTKDVDNDNADWGNCGAIYKGGWWYDRCHVCNLNGVYNETEYGRGITWAAWHGNYYSLKYVQMAIRPRKS